MTNTQGGLQRRMDSILGKFFAGVLARPTARILSLLLIVLSTGACGQNVDDFGDAKLDSLQLFVRPGILDFGFNVGHFLTCFAQPTGAKVVRTTYDDTGETVRVQSGIRWVDFHFRTMGDSALLDFARGSDGSVSQGWNELYVVVLMMTQACQHIEGSAPPLKGPEPPPKSEPPLKAEPSLKGECVLWNAEHNFCRRYQ
jgi:hypothetical protein